MQAVNIAQDDSSLLTVLDDYTYDPFLYNLDKGLTKGLKTTHNIKGSFIRKSADTPYSNVIEFHIPQNLGYLAQMTVETYLTCTGDNTTMEDMIGAKIYKDISLKTLEGLRVITSQSPESCIARMDGLQSNIKTTIQSAVEPSDVFNNNTVQVMTPLFFYFSEEPKLFLNTSILDPLVLHCTINDNKTAMGLSSDITNLSCNLICTFISMTDSKKLVSSYPKPYRVLAYDYYSEIPVAIDNGATSIKMQLKCPHDVYAIHVNVYDSSKNVHRIDKLILYKDTNVITEVDRRADFKLWSPTQNMADDTFATMTHWFSLYKSRTKNMMALPLQNLSNVSLEATFYDATPNANYSIYVVCEYWTTLFFEPSLKENKLSIRRF